MTLHPHPADQHDTRATKAARAARPSLVAGGLAAAVLLPAVLLPTHAVAQTSTGETEALPPLSTAPVATPAAAKRKAAKAAAARHRVRSGENLWTISERLAGPGASDAKVMKTLVAVWNANDVRIGTGDPDMLPVGVNLKIPASLR